MTNPLDSLAQTYNNENVMAVATKGKPGVHKIAGQNISAAKVAAVDTLGRGANAAIIGAVKPHLPMMVRGYAESPLFALLMANLVNVAIQQTGLGGDKAKIVSYAMMQSAYLDLTRSFDIEKIVTDFITKVPASALDAAREAMTFESAAQ